MKCECGTTEMHRYFHHVGKGVERFRCLKCNSRYELQAGKIVKLDSPDFYVDEQAWQKLKIELGIK